MRLANSEVPTSRIHVGLKRRPSRVPLTDNKPTNWRNLKYTKYLPETDKMVPIFCH